MTLIFIIGILVIVGVGVVEIISKEKKKTNTPYYSTKVRIEKDITYFSIIGDWRKVQELKLQELWLDSVRELYTYNYLDTDKRSNENEILAKLTIDDLKYPLNWSIDNYEHIIFVYKIVYFFSEIVVNNKDKRMYKPENSLPIPKSVLKKAFDYFIELTENDKNELKNEFKVEEIRTIMDFVYCQKPLLDMFYIDTGDEDLPQEKMENYTAGHR